MTLHEFWNRLKTWTQRDRLDTEVAAELDTHAKLLARELERQGLSSADALAAARRQVGNKTAQRETSRDAWGFPGVDIVMQVSAARAALAKVAKILLASHLETGVTDAFAAGGKDRREKLDELLRLFESER